MSSIDPDDLLLVNRGGVSNQFLVTEVMSYLADDDLVLVNRSGSSYKLTGQDLRDSIGPPPTIFRPDLLTPSNGAGVTFQPTTAAITEVVGGADPGTTYDAVNARDTLTWTFTNPPTPSNSIPNWTGSIDFTATFGSPPPTSGVSSALWMIDCGAPCAPSFVRFPSALPAEVWVILWSDDGVNWTFDETAYNRAVENGIPMYPDNSVYGSGPHRYWTYSRVTSKPELGSGTSVAATAIIDYNYGCGDLVIANSGATLTFANETDLGAFNVGDQVTQSGGGATGQVDDVDLGTNTMALINVTGTWETGRSVIGPTSLVGGAAPGQRPILTGTAFSSDGSIPHTGTDWQITQTGDVFWQNLVASSANDPVYLTQWPSPELDGEVTYMARVRYRSNQVISPWSNINTFKTKFDATKMTPPYSFYQATNNTTHTKFTSPVSFVNTGSYVWRGQWYYAVGLDGKVYVANASSETSFYLHPEPAVAAMTDVVDFWQSYESQVGDTAWVALHSDNTISNGMGDTTFDGKTVKRLMKNNNLMWGVGVQDNDDNFYLFNDNYVGSHFYGSQVIGVNGYDFMASTGMPAGVTRAKQIGLYGPYQCYSTIILGSDGHLYCEIVTQTTRDWYAAQGLNYTGNANETSVGIITAAQTPVFTDIAGFYNNSGESGFSALEDDGTLWVCQGNNGPIYNGSYSFAPWMDGTQFKSCVVGLYSKAGGFALRADGKLVGLMDAKANSPSDWQVISVPGDPTIESIGSQPGSDNCYGINHHYLAP